jgi:hypothetical protein
MANRKSALALLAAGVGGAAVAGYGLSIGRDMWKATKKTRSEILFLSMIVAVLLGAVALPFIGGRELVKGHDRGVIGTIFITILGSVALVPVGIVLAFFVWGFFVDDKSLPPDRWTDKVIYLATWSTAISAAAGLLSGLSQRSARIKALTIVRANERFLRDHGFRDTGGTDISHYDSADQPLRFLEAHPDRLVFMAVGRRGKRAHIKLAPDGRMVSYSGVV